MDNIRVVDGRGVAIEQYGAVSSSINLTLERSLSGGFEKAFWTDYNYEKVLENSIDNKRPLIL